jgi:hypothetical protein
MSHRPSARLGPEQLTRKCSCHRGESKSDGDIAAHGVARITHQGERRVETVGLSPTEMRLTNLKARLGSGLDDRMG